MATYSVIIPTLGRSQSYEETKESLYQQSNQDFEIVKVTEEGSLASLRNEGARRARGQYLIFIDDDVVCSTEWIEAMHRSFQKGYAGVSGPAVITKEFRRNRDCFRYQTGFLSSRRPGIISPWGQWSHEASKETCSYSGPVDYLEACNMAFKASSFKALGGFDERYGGIGDWSEPDLCFRLRQAGYRMWFSRDARLEHKPSQSGAYKKRLRPANRMENYELFSQRWVEPTFRHRIFKFILRIYFNLKETKC